MIVLYCLLGIIGLLLAVILIRTALFRPKAQPEAKAEAVSSLFFTALERAKMV